MRQVQHFFYLLIFFTFQTNAQYCTQDARYSEKEFFTDTQIDSKLNIKYAAAKDKHNVKQDLRLDLFYPNSAHDPSPLRPAIILFHGGAFQAGAKENMTAQCIALAKRGYVCATVEYRLGDVSDNAIEQILRIYRADQDAQAALRWITANANTYSIDTAWMFVGGVSAGSVISHDIIYNQQADWDAIFPLAKSQLGGLYTSGNTLTNSFSVKGLYNNCGSAIGAAVQKSEMLPTISFHKVYDNVVDIDTSAYNSYGSRTMHNWLNSEGVCTELTLDTNYYSPSASESDHCPFTDLAGTTTRVNRTSCFFKSIFCSSCSTLKMEEIAENECSKTISTEKTQELEITISPNPIENEFQISGVPNNSMYEVRNSMGLLIKKDFVRSINSLANLPSGIYFISVYLETGVKTKKILVQ